MLQHVMKNRMGTIDEVCRRFRFMRDVFAELGLVEKDGPFFYIESSAYQGEFLQHECGNNLKFTSPGSGPIKPPILRKCEMRGQDVLAQNRTRRVRVWSCSHFIIFQFLNLFDDEVTQTFERIVNRHSHQGASHGT